MAKPISLHCDTSAIGGEPAQRRLRRETNVACDFERTGPCITRMPVEASSSALSDRALEAMLRALFAIALPRRENHPDDEILELGTNCLGLVELYANINRAFPNLVSYTEFLAQPTLSSLARYMTRKRSSAWWP
jgi:hypothetical protein